MTEPASTPNLAHLPVFDPEHEGAVTVVIETSKGSRNKFGYQPEIGTFRLKHVLPEGSAFPYDFGFMPSTRGGDGDPLDVLVLLDEPAPLGSVVAVRLIGVLEARQRNADEAWTENHRFLGVPLVAQATKHIAKISDLRPHLLDEIEAFFVQYNRMRGGDFAVVARGGPERARELIEAGRITAAPV